MDNIRLNPGGGLDALIRKVAFDSKSTLISADNVQSAIALVEGIDVLYCDAGSEFEEEVDSEIDEMHEMASASIQDFFDSSSMSVHLRGHCVPMAKRGRPGQWKLEAISEEKMPPAVVAKIANKIIRQAKNDEESFIEKNMPGVTVVQLKNYRIVICRPPFSNIYEVTAVKPIVSLTIEDYHLPKKIFERFTEAEGILVAGRPGAGKSTFISALAEHYLEKNKLVKTIESVRDLNVPAEIAQYGMLDGSFEGTADILLLIRPDYTIFDEVRTKEDFKIFGDMRLSGIGLVGVVHASKAVDAIQRFIRRIELGVIPNVIDTVVFIEKGRVEEVLSIEMIVKKPSGFTDRDLSRPVIEVRDFLYDELLYEIYEFGSNVVVTSVGTPRSYRDNRYSDTSGGKKPGNQVFNAKDTFKVKIHRMKQKYLLKLDENLGTEYLHFYTTDGTYLFSATLNKNGQVYARQRSPLYHKVKQALREGNKIIASLNELT